MNKKIILGLIFITSVGFSTVTYSQNVGINTSGSNADASSMLDVSATDKGILIPRVSLVNVSNSTAPVNAPAAGLLVYNTNAAVVGGYGVGFYYWSGTAWTKMATGNTLTASLTNGRIWVGDGSNIPTERLLSGDVAIDNTGVATIQPDAVTNAKQADMAANTVKVNNTATPANPTDMAIGANTVLGRQGGNIVAAQVATGQIADNAVDGSKINIASNTNGDLMYYNGTDWVRVASGTSGQILRTNGAAAPTWVDASTVAVTSIATNNGITGGTITSTGTIGLTGQALALHNLGTNGVMVRTGAGTVTTRTIGISGTGVAVTNGDGVAGNPTINLDYGNMLSGGTKPVGNFGQYQNHSTYTDFNVTPSYWGWNYVQGNTNAPNATSTQWYRQNISLGAEYPGRGAGGYSLELAYPRDNAAAAGIWMRTVENGTIGSWLRLDAGAIGSGTTNTIPKWTSATTLGNSTMTDDGTTLTTSDQFDVTGGTGTVYTSAPIEVRTTATPRISFHWPGVVASQIGMDAAGVIRTYNNPGTGYEQFAASNITANGNVTATGFVSITSASTGAGNLRFSAANPYIVSSSYFIAPGGAYFNSGTVYTEAQMQTRGGIHDDTHGTLSIAGGTAGTTTITGILAIGTASTLYGSNASINANPNNTNGGGIIVSDDGGFVDYNDGPVTFVGSTGLRIAGNNGAASNNAWLRINGLAGTGNRVVRADANGTLTVGVATCPAGFTTIDFTASRLCIYNDAFSTTWLSATGWCYNLFGGSSLCRHEQIRRACAYGGFALTAGRWLADRSGDDNALTVNGTDCNNFDGTANANNASQNGEYCCIEYWR